MNNVLQFLKKGNRIHIKEKNKGKFTSYCGGKVTDECIRKAKNSGNPTLVKRATFAQNSRKWKHQKGGYIIKSQEGTKFNFSKITDFLNSDQGELAIQGISQIINKINDTKMEQKLQDWKEHYLKSVTPNTDQYYQKVEDEENQLKQMNPDYNPSPIDTAYKANKLAQEDYLQQRQAAEQEADQYIREQLSNNQGYGDLLSTGLGLVGSFLSKKSNNSSINQTKPNYSNNWTKPNYSNNYTFKLSSFWDNPTLQQ